MEITEVRVFPKEGSDKKLKAYATITIDNAFVVRNVKVIEGNKGLFVAMPSRKIKDSCPKCNYKNVVRSKFCNQCGSSLPQREPRRYAEGEVVRESEHKDIAHPISIECREYIQKKVLSAYQAAKSGAGAEPYRAPASSEPTYQAGAEPKPEPKPEEPETEVEGGDIEL